MVDPLHRPAGCRRKDRGSWTVRAAGRGRPANATVCNGDRRDRGERVAADAMLALTTEVSGSRHRETVLTVFASDRKHARQVRLIVRRVSPTPASHLAPPRSQRRHHRNVFEDLPRRRPDERGQAEPACDRGIGPEGSGCQVGAGIPPEPAGVATVCRPRQTGHRRPPRRRAPLLAPESRQRSRPQPRPAGATDEHIRRSCWPAIAPARRALRSMWRAVAAAAGRARARRPRRRAGRSAGPARPDRPRRWTAARPHRRRKAGPAALRHDRGASHLTCSSEARAV